MKITEVRRVLENERKRLLIEQGLHSNMSSSDRAASPFNKKMEAANQIAELERKFAMAKRVNQQIASIEHALDKIAKGTYGFCDNCKKPIANERLKAIPQANLCLSCKSNQHRNLLKSYAK
jgi:RNA polymerase-binding protein DksA